ncbi:MAG: signal peptidase II, partial [Bradyrhizobium sp.]
VHLTYVKNTGAAFSIFSGQRWPLIVLTLAVLAVIVYAVARRYVRHPFGVLTLAAIVGGAVGNLIDRARQGFVVDMFEVEFMRFAVFNVADIFLTCGAVALCFYIIFFFGKDEKARLAEKHHDDSE